MNGISVTLPDEASTLGDNGYGDFALVGGSWTYTLNNAHASVQALDVGETLVDAHTFTFDVSVPARGETTVEYTVRVRWC